MDSIVENYYNYINARKNTLAMEENVNNMNK